MRFFFLIYLTHNFVTPLEILQKSLPCIAAQALIYPYDDRQQK